MVACARYLGKMSTKAAGGIPRVLLQQMSCKISREQFRVCKQTWLHVYFLNLQATFKANLVLLMPPALLSLYVQSICLKIDSPQVS